MNNIGHNIRILRESKGLTQAEVAKKLSIKRETVNQWENNVRDLKTDKIIKLSELFGCTFDEILTKPKLERLMGKNKKLDEIEIEELKKNAKNELCFEFAIRLRECFLKKPDINQAELAKKSSCCSPSSVTSYLKASQEPCARTVLNFAKIFDVSTDYLLGNTHVSTNNIDLKYVCEYTKLSEKAIKSLIDLDEEFINWFLSDNDTLFILKAIFNYVTTGEIGFYSYVIEQMPLLRKRLT